jgi:hypothetical protein
MATCAVAIVATLTQCKKNEEKQAAATLVAGQPCHGDSVVVCSADRKAQLICRQHATGQWTFAVEIPCHGPKGCGDGDLARGGHIDNWCDDSAAIEGEQCSPYYDKTAQTCTTDGRGVLSCDPKTGWTKKADCGTGTKCVAAPHEPVNHYPAASCVSE